MPGPTSLAGRQRSVPSAVEHGDGAGIERQQTLGRGARAAARAPVEIAADQQEEQQHHRGIEIGVLAAADRLGRLIAAASETPSAIGTSMLVRRWRSAPQAEAKNGRPA